MLIVILIILISHPIGVCCAQTHKLSQMDIWPVGLQDHFFPKRVKFGFGDGNNVYEMRGSNPIFSQDPRNIVMWVGKWKKGKQRWFMPISSHDVPKFGFGYGKM